MKSKPTVYVESSIIGYLTSRPSQDPIISEYQSITKEWWEQERNKFDIFVSEFVIKEAKQGDPNEAQKRLEILETIPIIQFTEEVETLADRLVLNGPLPKKAYLDALHIATSVVNGLDYLLTWNCKHIANAFIQKRVFQLAVNLGYNHPVICTPEELIGDTL